MSKIDFVLVSATETKAAPQEGEFTFDLHSSKKDTDKLVEMWPTVMTRLQEIIDRSDFPRTKGEGYKLDTIEVHLGIEAGFTIGFAAKTNADLTLTFKRAEVSPAPKP